MHLIVEDEQELSSIQKDLHCLHHSNNPDYELGDHYCFVCGAEIVFHVKKPCRNITRHILHLPFEKLQCQLERLVPMVFLFQPFRCAKITKTTLRLIRRSQARVSGPHLWFAFSARVSLHSPVRQKSYMDSLKISLSLCFI